jgi:hypothetical protein
MIRYSARTPGVTGAYARLARDHFKARRAAAIVATDIASVRGRAAVQTKMRGAGLGRLGNAIGQTSTRKLRRSGAVDKPFGVMFARNGDESQAGGTLEAYSRGAFISAKRGKWLAIPQRAIPRFINFGGRRLRTTPEIYNASSLVQTIGKLVFIQTSATRAKLVVRKVTLSPKTGRAARDRGQRVRSRVREKEVVAFRLILNTRRAQRFDKDSEFGREAAKVPDLISDELARQGYIG